jgi:superfamily I DNA/RNA helicase
VQELQALAAKLGVKARPGSSVKKFFKAPGKEKWAEVLCVHESASLGASSIHEAKGHEYRAVCVAIPAKGERTEELIRSWEGRTALEAKRVIYVGITRAEELIVIAVPRPYSDRIAAILRAAGVQYDQPEPLTGSAKRKSTHKRKPKAPRNAEQSLLFEDM